MKDRAHPPVLLRRDDGAVPATHGGHFLSEEQGLRNHVPHAGVSVHRLPAVVSHCDLPDRLSGREQRYERPDHHLAS